MRLGVCIAEPSEAREFAGVADFAEIPGRDLVAATAEEARAWARALAVLPSAPVCSRLLPYGITLHDAPENRRRLDEYWNRLLDRGTALGVGGYCLGAGAAREVADDDPGRDAGIAGIRHVIAGLAQRTADAGATLYLEPLRPAECRWLNRAADGAAVGPAGVLGLCADLEHVGDEAAGDGWPAGVSWARAAHCHVSGPDHGPLTGYEEQAAAFVAAVARGVRIDGVSLEQFSGPRAGRRADLERLRRACAASGRAPE